MKNERYINAPSPCYVVDEEALLENLALIDRVRKEAEIEVIVALKASAMWSIFPTLADHSDGATSSSLSEAKLVNEFFRRSDEPNKEILSHTYSPIYTDQEIDDILALSSHITFNSLGQYERHRAKAQEAGVSCGIRINPRYSPVETDLYNPCIEGSRLGVVSEMMPQLPEGIEGLHFHVLCESRPEHLRLALEAVEREFGELLPKIKWLNMGGGHLMTHEDYDCTELIDIIRKFKAKHPHLRLIMEPGSAFTWRTGVLTATIEDVVRNGATTTAMLNMSFACHTPDCLEMPYKPSIIGARDPKEGEQGWQLGGNSCLAGDYMGEWIFEDGHEPQLGERIIFEDMIHYTMVKTTMFNGVSHPAIAIRRSSGEVEIIKEFGYEDYRGRMS